MKPVTSALVLLALMTATTLAAAPAVTPQRPVVLVFETTKGQGAENDLVSACTKALRDYFRYTKRVEATILDRGSPTVLRAIMEKRMTADQVASYASRDERLLVAKTLGFEYAAGAELSIAEGSLQVKLWLGKVDGGKKANWEATGAARATGAGAMDLNNALQSAASMAVMEVTRQALGDLPTLNGSEPDDGSRTTAIGAAEPPPVKQPSAADYLADGDRAVESGNFTLAIQSYMRAVDADPGSVPARTKLAEAYARKGMFKEAYDELNRAAAATGDHLSVSEARQRIQAMENPPAPGVSLEPAKPAQPNPAEQPLASEPTPAEDLSKPAPAAAVAKMKEGDRLWVKGRHDEAAECYAEAIKLNPKDWRAYERLSVINASMGLFTESRKVLEMLNKVQPAPEPQIVERRYGMFQKAFDGHFALLMRQYASDLANYSKGKLSRESCYNAFKGLGTRLESMAKFLDAVNVPSAKQPAHLHRSLAVGLASQAASSLLEHLETNSDAAKSNADVFIAQARREIENAAALDENKVIVRKEEPPAEPASEPSGEQPQPPYEEPPPAEAPQPPYEEPPPQQPAY